MSFVSQSFEDFVKPQPEPIVPPLFSVDQNNRAALGFVFGPSPFFSNKTKLLVFPLILATLLLIFCVLLAMIDVFSLQEILLGQRVSLFT